jgi:hypothetical protein
VIIEPTQKLLKETFDYHPDGYLTWLKPKTSWIKIGSRAGGDRGDGYHYVGYGGKNHLLHRLIFLYHYGYLPELIDHIDQDRTNNRIENLKDASRRENIYNTSKLWKHNTSGIRGVSWDSSQQKWSVRFRHDGKYLFFGYFEDINEAKQKREEVERRHLHYD